MSRREHSPGSINGSGSVVVLMESDRQVGNCSASLAPRAASVIAHSWRCLRRFSHESSLVQIHEKVKQFQGFGNSVGAFCEDFRLELQFLGAPSYFRKKESPEAVAAEDLSP
jgi:hypothetical protein